MVVAENSTYQFNGDLLVSLDVCAYKVSQLWYKCDL